MVIQQQVAILKFSQEKISTCPSSLLSWEVRTLQGVDLTEAEDIKKRWYEYTQELNKKDINDPDNHDGMITHLQTDILEWEVKWALWRITTNKASGGDGITVELFQILKDVL